SVGLFDPGLQEEPDTHLFRRRTSVQCLRSWALAPLLPPDDCSALFSPRLPPPPVKPPLHNSNNGVYLFLIIERGIEVSSHAMTCGDPHSAEWYFSASRVARSCH